MNFNDKIQPKDQSVLHAEQEQPYQKSVLQSLESQDRVTTKTKTAANFISKSPLLRGKQNDFHSVNNKNIVTNHSFNGLFNENTSKFKRNRNEQGTSKTEGNEMSRQNYQVNSHDDFNNTDNLSNMQFVEHQSNDSHLQSNIHSEVQAFLLQHFVENLHPRNIQAKYVRIQHFVETLFQDFQNLIGKQNSLNLMNDFCQKMFLIFGDKVYFEDLFDKTLEGGLTGLIFQILKLIKEDQNQNNQQRQSKNSIKIQAVNLPKGPLINKNLIHSNLNLLKGSKNFGFLECNNRNFDNSRVNHLTSEKISLSKYFGSSVARSQFDDTQQLPKFNESNLEEIKQILSDYIAVMYEEAQSKLNKKYTQQIKKITLKHKQVQKLLDKINEKITNHYDSLQLQKKYEKKIKIYIDKQTELQNKIKNLQHQLKSAQDDAQKEKNSLFKLDQDMIKLKQKLEKYENAIFQKAMFNSPNQNTILGSSLSKQLKTNSSFYSQQSSNAYHEPNENPQRFQHKIDPMPASQSAQIPLASISKTYTPYVSQMSVLTPTRIKQIERIPSLSPIKQRVSFIKNFNPNPGKKIEKLSSPINCNSKQISYTNLGQNQMKKQIIQIGQKIQLRPLVSPEKFDSNGGRLDLQKVQNLQGNQNFQTTQKIYAQRSYSPIKIKYCSSRASTLPVQYR